MAEIKTSVASLQEGQARLETDVARMGGDLARMNSDLRRLTGKDYEGYVIRFAERLINRTTDLERPSVVGSDRNGWAHPHMRDRNTEAASSGTIGFEAADDLEMADVVLSGRTPLGGLRYVIIETSTTVQESDVLTAKKRAAVLQKASDIVTIPVVVGVLITAEARAATEEEDVLFIPYNPGEGVQPRRRGSRRPSGLNLSSRPGAIAGLAKRDLRTQGQGVQEDTPSAPSTLMSTGPTTSPPTV